LDKKNQNLNADESIPEILEVEEQEIEEKKPPNDYIIDYHLVNDTNDSSLDDKKI
jgi:hypothetical protein